MDKELVNVIIILLLLMVCFCMPYDYREKRIEGIMSMRQIPLNWS
jgi:hypothetical protein